MLHHKKDKNTITITVMQSGQTQHARINGQDFSKCQQPRAVDQEGLEVDRCLHKSLGEPDFNLLVGFLAQRQNLHLSL